MLGIGIPVETFCKNREQANLNSHEISVGSMRWIEVRAACKNLYYGRQWKVFENKNKKKNKIERLGGNKINEWYYIARVTSSIFLAKEQFKVFFENVKNRQEGIPKWMWLDWDDDSLEFMINSDNLKLEAVILY